MNLQQLTKRAEATAAAWAAQGIDPVRASFQQMLAEIETAANGYKTAGASEQAERAACALSAVLGFLRRGTELDKTEVAAPLEEAFSVMRDLANGEKHKLITQCEFQAPGNAALDLVKAMCLAATDALTRKDFADGKMTAREADLFVQDEARKHGLRRPPKRGKLKEPPQPIRAPEIECWRHDIVSRRVENYRRELPKGTDLLRPATTLAETKLRISEAIRRQAVSGF